MIARCKGCSDLLPEDMLRFRYIESIFHDSCITWGYEEVRTPMLEYLSLFTSSGTLTPQMLKRVYSFLDWDGWSGERVVLRPDGTIPAARLYIDNLQEMEVARLCYTSNIFRFDETGKKSRENWQLGAELIGVTGSEANAELITLALETLSRLGFEDVELRLSHSQLIKAVLAQLEPNADEQHKIFDQLLDGDVALMSRLEAEKPELFRTLKLLMENKGTSAAFLKNVMAMAGAAGGDLEEPLNDFIAGVDVLDKLGVSYQIDLASGKGFEYYTGVIFHLFVNGEHVGGGGRYDKLIPLLGGLDKPAAGFALYLNRLIPMIDAEDMYDMVEEKILIKYEGDNLKNAYEMANLIRECGISAELFYPGVDTAAYGWAVTVKAADSYEVTDLIEDKTTEFKNQAEVICLLSGEEDA